MGSIVPIKVLLCDRNPMYRVGISAILAPAGLEMVGAVGSVGEAIEVAQRTTPDVMLLESRLAGEYSSIDFGLKMHAEYGTRFILVAPSDVQLLLAEWVLMVQRGVSGFILHSAQPEEVVLSVRAVMLGRTFLGTTLQPVMLEEVVALVHHIATCTQVEVADDQTLTPRELEILSFVAQGFINRDIAEKIIVSEATVKNHIANILRKLGLHTRVQASLYAVQAGLLGMTLKTDPKTGAVSPEVKVDGKVKD